MLLRTFTGANATRHDDVTILCSRTLGRHDATYDPLVQAL